MTTDKARSFLATNTVVLHPDGQVGSIATLIAKPERARAFFAERYPTSTILNDHPVDEAVAILKKAKRS